MTDAPREIWVEHHGYGGELGMGDGEVFLSPPKNPSVPVTRYIRADVVEALAGALTDVEWSGSAYGPGTGPHGSGGDGPRLPACPLCRGIKPGGGAETAFRREAIGHRPGCRLAVARTIAEEG